MNILELSEQEIGRRQSLQELRDMGIEPYPAAEFPVNAYSTDIREQFSDDAEPRQVSVAGRLMGRRVMGKASFAEVQDSKGRGHAFDALLGFSASANDMNYFSLKAEGLLTDELKWNNLQGVTNKENLTPYTTNEHVVKESVFARVNYNYRQKYYLTMTGRPERRIFSISSITALYFSRLVL